MEIMASMLVGAVLGFSCEWVNAHLRTVEGLLGMTPHKCPVCDGAGTVSRPPHVAGDVGQWSGSSTTASHPCRACKETGIVWEPDR